ncbi:hypothetical protein GJ496_003664 [Pomphorhynchus laevis]|nr:hypothetical protein GJ496_003664 [Pomphorhynchus laevis]
MLFIEALQKIPLKHKSTSSLINELRVCVQVMFYTKHSPIDHGTTVTTLGFFPSSLYILLNSSRFIKPVSSRISSCKSTNIMLQQQILQELPNRNEQPRTRSNHRAEDNYHRSDYSTYQGNLGKIIGINWNSIFRQRNCGRRKKELFMSWIVAIGFQLKLQLNLRKRIEEHTFAILIEQLNKHFNETLQVLAARYGSNQCEINEILPYSTIHMNEISTLDVTDRSDYLNTVKVVGICNMVPTILLTLNGVHCKIEFDKEPA